MSRFIGFDVTWTGADGTEWDLRRGPVQITDAGIAGLGFATFNEYTRTPPLQDGQILDGVQQKPRNVFLPLFLGVDIYDTLEWLALERAFYAGLRPDQNGTLTVTAPDGDTRSVRIRFKDDGGAPYELDPAVNAMSIAGLNMTADDPWWRGPDAGVTFGLDGPEDNFFGGSTGYGPPFIITSANTAGEWTLQNPGDVDAWPTWVVAGPATGFQFIVDGSEVSGTVDLAEGETLTINTDPTSQLVIITDSEGGRTLVPAYSLSSYEFARVPRGESVDVTALVYGLGDVGLQLFPRYYRAW